jgi:TPR repeat protein
VKNEAARKNEFRENFEGNCGSLDRCRASSTAGFGGIQLGAIPLPVPVKWYRLAADQGNAKGQTGLGFMYDNGYGVPQDYVQAHMWWNLAAAQGDEDAIGNRDIIAGQMMPSQIEEAQRLAREWIAAHP